MNEMTGNRLRRILMFAAIVEIGTGLALLIDPRFVVSLLIGTNLSIGDTDRPTPRRRDSCTRIGLLAERGRRAQRLAGFPRDAGLQRAHCIVPRLSVHR